MIEFSVSMPPYCAPPTAFTGVSLHLLDRLRFQSTTSIVDIIVYLGVASDFRKEMLSPVET